MACRVPADEPAWCAPWPAWPRSKLPAAFQDAKALPLAKFPEADCLIYSGDAANKQVRQAVILQPDCACWLTCAWCAVPCAAALQILHGMQRAC